MNPASRPADVRRKPAATARRVQPGWARLIRTVHSRWTTYALCLADLRRQGLTEKAVHDYRVASQRFAAALRLCAHAVASPAPRTLRRRIRRRFDRFRRLRDVQVMFQRLAPAVPEAPIIGRLHGRLAREAASLQRKLQRKLHRRHPQPERAEMRSILGALGTVARGPVRKRVYVLLHDRLALAQRRVMRCSAQVVATDLATLHRLRIAIKRARYLLELVAEAREAPWARAAHRAARGWQDLLGQCQDLRVLDAELATLRPKQLADAAALKQLRMRIATERDEGIRTFLRQRDALESFVRQILPPGQSAPEARPNLSATA
jgi:CHAD domain-containing protein